MKLYPSISDDLASWASRQPVFFTASAPTFGSHVNVSPKGLTSSHLVFIDSNTVAYIDRTGSGCETIAHSYENGRLTLLFISFGQSPRILRLFCRSRVVERDSPAFEAWMARVLRNRQGGGMEGARAVIVCDVWQVQTSCGYGVPMVKKELYSRGEAMENTNTNLPSSADDTLSQHQNAEVDELIVFTERRTLEDSWRKKAESGLIDQYQALNNSASLDGLPGLRAARKGAGQWLWATDLRARLLRVRGQRDGIVLGFIWALLLLYGISAFRRGSSVS